MTVTKTRLPSNNSTPQTDQPFTLHFGSKKEYQSWLHSLAMEGARQAIAEAPVVDPFFTLEEAEKNFGKSRISALIENKSIYPINDPPQVLIDRIQLLKAIQA